MNIVYNTDYYYALCNIFSQFDVYNKELSTFMAGGVRAGWNKRGPQIFWRT